MRGKSFNLGLKERLFRMGLSKPHLHRRVWALLAHMHQQIRPTKAQKTEQHRRFTALLQLVFLLSPSPLASTALAEASNQSTQSPARRR
jgi:hypothetical protein